MHSHVAIRRQWGCCFAPLCYVGAGKVKGGSEGVCQLGRAKLFSMHALKAAQRFCVVPENICPQGISYILLSLTLRLAKLFDKPLAMFAQKTAREEGGSSVRLGTYLAPHPLPTLLPFFLRHFL